MTTTDPNEYSPGNEKLATVDKSVVVKVLGKLSGRDWHNAQVALRNFFDQILPK
jgi:hypothetical protein